MWDAIKSLSPKQRFAGFIITLLVTSIVTLGTVYFKTDDCSGISDQYTVLAKNYTEILHIHNELVKYDNERAADFGKIKSMIADMSVLEQIVTSTTVNKPTHTAIITGSIVNDSMPAHKTIQPIINNRETVTVIRERPKNYESLRDSLLFIIDKYTKK